MPADELNGLSDYIILGNDSGTLVIKASNPDLTLSDIYTNLHLIIRQIENLILDEDENWKCAKTAHKHIKTKNAPAQT